MEQTVKKFVQDVRIKSIWNAKNKNFVSIQIYITIYVISRYGN